MWVVQGLRQAVVGRCACDIYDRWLVDMPLVSFLNLLFGRLMLVGERKKTKKNDWKIGDSCVWQRQKYMFQWISISKRLKTTKVAANRINQWWMCCQTKEAQNEMLESLFFQYNVKDQQDKLFMSDLVKALMPRPPAPPSQFSPALLRSFVFFCKIQMKQQDDLLRPGIRSRTWGRWDNSTPAMERKFPNQEVEATFQMEYLFYWQK